MIGKPVWSWDSVLGDQFKH